MVEICIFSKVERSGGKGWAAFFHLSNLRLDNLYWSYFCWTGILWSLRACSVSPAVFLSRCSLVTSVLMCRSICVLTPIQKSRFLTCPLVAVSFKENAQNFKSLAKLSRGAPNQASRSLQGEGKEGFSWCHWFTSMPEDTASKIWQNESWLQ